MPRVDCSGIVLVRGCFCGVRRFPRVRPQSTKARSVKANGLPSPLRATRHQLYLGDDAFVAQLRQETLPEQLRELSLAHKRSLALSLSDYQASYPDRDEAMAKAYQAGAYTMAEIVSHFRCALHDS